MPLCACLFQSVGKLCIPAFSEQGDASGGQIQKLQIEQ